MATSQPGQINQEVKAGQEQRSPEDRVKVYGAIFRHNQIVEQVAQHLQNPNTAIDLSDPEVKRTYDALFERHIKGESAEDMAGSARRDPLSAELNLRRSEAVVLKGEISKVSQGDISSATDDELMQAAVLHKNNPTSNYRRDTGIPAEEEIYRRVIDGHQSIDQVISSINEVKNKKAEAKRRYDTARGMQGEHTMMDPTIRAELSRELNKPGANRAEVFSQAESGWLRLVDRDANKLKLGEKEERIRQIETEQTKIQEAKKQQIAAASQPEGGLAKARQAIGNFLKK